MALTLPFITALMLAQPVSATDVIDDAQYDTPVWCFGSDATPNTNLWCSNPPMVRVGYFDMMQYSLSLDEAGDHYIFWMRVMADLPEDGYVFPSGLAAGEWLMYIDPGPYNAVYNPVIPLFVIGLRYDGSQYGAFLYDSATGERTPLEPGSYGYSGSELSIEFPTSVLNGLELDSLWWCAGTKAYLGTEGIGWRLVDTTDYDEVLATWDVPWPV